MNGRAAIRVLLLDNYDSFTWNLYQYLEEIGASTEVVRNDRIRVDAIEPAGFQAVVLSPGPGRPEEAGISVELVRCLAGRLPILGVCLGHQAIGHAFGARIVAAPALVHGKTSSIFHDGRTIFRGIRSPFRATRYHSLVVDGESLSAELEVSARTRDGVVMGLRHRQHLLEGVQFHPESVLTVEGKKLLRNFLDLAISREPR
jgi:anthranilate synthase/aminodeoxychorismate synthase-like glutamine amidotransferase